MPLKLAAASESAQRDEMVSRWQRICVYLWRDLSINKIQSNVILLSGCLAMTWLVVGNGIVDRRNSKLAAAS